MLWAVPPPPSTPQRPPPIPYAQAPTPTPTGRAQPRRNEVQYDPANQGEGGVEGEGLEGGEGDGGGQGEGEEEGRGDAEEEGSSEEEDYGTDLHIRSASASSASEDGHSKSPSNDFTPTPKARIVARSNAADTPAARASAVGTIGTRTNAARTFATRTPATRPNAAHSASTAASASHNDSSTFRKAAELEIARLQRLLSDSEVSEGGTGRGQRGISSETPVRNRDRGEWAQCLSHSCVAVTDCFVPPPVPTAPHTATQPLRNLDETNSGSESNKSLSAQATPTPMAAAPGKARSTMKRGGLAGSKSMHSLRDRAAAAAAGEGSLLLYCDTVVGHH